MSAFLLGIGFRADMGTCARKLVLLKLIDACEDDGSRIFPAISTIARAAQCSSRQVQRELQAFREIGLIRLVREGGKGPRSTNEYALDLDLLTRLGKEGWAIVTAAGTVAEAENKGDTVSPLDDGEKGDTGDAVRVTPATDKGDIACHPTPPDPSLDPSIERERGREREDQKSVERDFKRAFAAWPTFVSDSEPDARKAWQRLTADERAEAFARQAEYAVEALKAGGRKTTCSYAKYLSEQRWTKLAPKAAPAAAAAVPDDHAPPFGPVWGGIRIKQFVGGVRAVPPGLTGIESQMVRDGTADEAALHRRKQARFGWPAVNEMHRLAMNGYGVPIVPAAKALEPLMEAVPVNSERFEEWRLEHDLRGWPWIPDPGQQPVVYFPKGGPAGLEAFETAIKRGGHDGGQRQAAE